MCNVFFIARTSTSFCFRQTALWFRIHFIWLPFARIRVSRQIHCGERNADERGGWRGLGGEYEGQGKGRRSPATHDAQRSRSQGRYRNSIHYCVVIKVQGFPCTASPSSGPLKRSLCSWRCPSMSTAEGLCLYDRPRGPNFAGYYVVVEATAPMHGQT